jgi:acetate kinase
MGFTPMGGLVMSTRSGDLDPGVLLHLLEQRGMTPAQIRETVSGRGGLLGVSGVSADMRELLEQEPHSADAALAIELFCYHARRAVASLAAVLGGVDTLVFTGGIGERAPVIRRRICAGLEFLGIEVDEGANTSGAGIVSTGSAGVTVRVIPADEELMLAHHAATLLAHG